jgi:hypothetical protein
VEPEMLRYIEISGTASWVVPCQAPHALEPSLRVDDPQYPLPPHFMYKIYEVEGLSKSFAPAGGKGETHVTRRLPRARTGASRPLITTSVMHHTTGQSAYQPRDSEGHFDTMLVGVRSNLVFCRICHRSSQPNRQ